GVWSAELRRAVGCVTAEYGRGVKIAERMKKTAPDGAVSGMPAIRETGPGKNLQAITVSTKGNHHALVMS
ncbi:hypothetical protein J4X29_15535, partial [Escherichia coli]